MSRDSIRRELKALFEEATFKTYLMDIIEDKMFLNKISNQLILERFTNHMNQELPNAVKQEAQRIIPHMVKEYVKDNFSSFISKQLDVRIPRYLDNSNKMQQILETHKMSIQPQLERYVTETINKITSDEMHHEVTCAYLNAIEQKVKQELQNDVNELKKRVDQAEEQTNILKKCVTGLGVACVILGVLGFKFSWS
jgi:hypothetical protein